MNAPAFRAERIHSNIAELAYSELEGLTFKSVLCGAQMLDSTDQTVTAAPPNRLHFSLGLEPLLRSESHRLLDTCG